MWIVKLALNRPYTFIVMALLILIASPVMILRTPTDIFPNIDIPVISVAWQYSGLNAEEVEGRITSPFERSLTTLVDNIQHLESTSYNGEAVIKVFLQPNANLANSMAQVTAVSQQQLKQMPPGEQPPEIINYSASSVPILQIGLSGKGLNEQQLNDLAMNFVRTADCHRAGRCRSRSLWGQAAPDHGESRSPAPPGQRPVRHRRAECCGQPKSDPALGHGEDRSG